jgi:hypothetical protein
MEVHEYVGALKVLHLSPRMGETEVAQVPDVVAVFSATVALEPGEADLNEETFFIENEQGERPDITVDKSILDELGHTAVIRVSEPLEPGGSYTVVIVETIRGRQEKDGVIVVTDPLGVEIRSTFTVAY